MNWETFLALLSMIGQLPTSAIIAVTCVLGGLGIGIGIAFRDIPKYIYKTVSVILKYIYKTLVVILDFILRLKGKGQLDVSPKQNEEKDNDKTKILKIIEGGKSEKKENHHGDGHAT